MRSLSKLYKKHKATLSIFLFLITFSAAFVILLSKLLLTTTAVEKTKMILTPKKEDVKIKILFSGDVFLGRGVDAKSMASKTSLFAYPFSKLSSLEPEHYDEWVANLECPITKEQATLFESEEYLRLTCRKEYLPELAKHFTILSLANNHTDNMKGRQGIEETRKNLSSVSIDYFGDYDNSSTHNICKVIYTKSIPIAYCGFHGVYKLPTDEELKVVSEFSKYFITIVMPHQGEEYKPKSNSYQKKIYRKLVDNGADLVVGSHPHVIQEVEEYKNKLIVYSLGNFIFDQIASETRRHMSLDAELLIQKYADNYKNLDCENLDSLSCLDLAKSMQIQKPEHSLRYKPIFTHSDRDMITRKTDLSPEKYYLRLKEVGFTLISESLKQTGVDE